jgi:uncharacterized protein (DUF58 family)
MRRVWPLTPRGTGALVLAVACFAVANQLGLVELVYFGILLLAVVAIAFASLYLVRRSEVVARSLSPDIAVVGQESTVTVRVSVRTALPTAPGTWRDTLPGEALQTGKESAAEGEFPAIGSGLRGGDRTVEFRYDLAAVRRGVHWLGPLQLTSADPFGLARRSSLVGERTRVTVAPAVVELPPLTSSAGDTGGTLHATTNQLGQGSDNLTPRHYVPGDSMRRIHWRASAHRDELMVRQEEQESTPEASVVFDRGLSRWTPEAMDAPGADPLFELGVSACVSAVARLVREGYSVEVVDSDGTVLWDPIDGGDGAQVDAMVTHFATLTARLDSDLGGVAKLFTGITTGPLVLVTGRLTPDQADAVAAVPGHSGLPMLFAVHAEGDALGRAEASGWRTADIGPGADLASAWSDAAERGVSHVFG